MFTKLIITFLVILLVTGLLGMLFTRFIRYEKDSIFLNFISGVLILLGLFQLVALPSIFLNLPFSQLSLLYSCVIIVACLLSIFLNRERLKNITMKLSSFSKMLLFEQNFKGTGIKKLVYEKINWVLVLVLVIFVTQISLYFLLEFGINIASLSFDVKSAMTTIYTDQLFRYNPLTGFAMAVFFEQYILSSYSIFLAFISDFFGLHPLIIVYSVMPVLFCAFYFSAYYLIGKDLFVGDSKKAIKFVFFCSIVVLFSGVGLGSYGRFALLQLHLGSSLLYVALLPLCFYFYMRLIHKDSTKADWIMLVVFLISSSMISEISIVLSTIGMGILGVTHLIYKKNIKEVCYMILCCIPNLILMTVFALSGRYSITGVVEVWNIITSFTYQRINSGDIVLGVFFLSLICVCVLGSDIRVKKVFGIFTVIFSIIYYLPLTSYLILRFGLNSYEIHQMFWLLPVIIVISYLFVFWENKLTSKRLKVCFFVAITLFFVVRGSTAYTLAEKSEDIYRIPIIIREIVEVINEDALYNEIEEKRVLFSREILPYVRQYDVSIITLSFANARMHNEDNLYRSDSEEKLFRELNTFRTNSSLLSYLMKHEDYNYLVMWRYTIGLNTLSVEFKEVAEISEYVIFRRESLESKPTLFDGIDYHMVFDYYFYLSRYEDVEEAVGTEPMAVLEHFVTVGMSKGRMGRESFNPYFYRNNYVDLMDAFGDVWQSYYHHYLEWGHLENRIADHAIPFYEDESFSPIFDFNFFMARYPEMTEAFDSLDEVFLFFVTEGMDLGLQGTRKFDVLFYKENNPDLWEEFGEDLRLYYIHFLEMGRFENRPSFDSPILRFITG